MKNAIAKTSKRKRKIHHHLCNPCNTVVGDNIASSGGIEGGEEDPRTQDGVFAYWAILTCTFTLSGLQGQENSNILRGVKKIKKINITRISSEEISPWLLPAHLSLFFPYATNHLNYWVSHETHEHQQTHGWDQEKVSENQRAWRRWRRGM